MEFKVEKMYEAKVLFEASASLNGYSYLVIYGKHINGYFCCIPNWQLCCEMSDANSVEYNKNKLICCGASNEMAQSVAWAISDIWLNGINIVTGFQTGSHQNGSGCQSPIRMY